MIRFVFRLLGLLCLALGFIFLVYDGVKSIADHGWFLTRVDGVCRMSDACEATLVQVRPAVERIAHWLWDPVLVQVLNAPSSLVLVIIGAVLLIIGRKRKPLIGYARH